MVSNLFFQQNEILLPLIIEQFKIKLNGEAHAQIYANDRFFILVFREKKMHIFHFPFFGEQTSFFNY